MNLSKLKLSVLCLSLTALLSGCESTVPEVTDPPQKQASAIKSQGGVYKVGNPYKIFGRWYYPKEDYSYSEVGIASWYGPDFHAKRTANGEKYNMHGLTAAHRTLPLPSIVKITNLENGRSLVVRVNDRGPYARNRIIDVSKKVAQLLGFLEKGTAKVRVEILEKESKNLKAAMTGKSISPNVSSAPTTEIVKSGIGEDVTPLAAAPAITPVVSSYTGRNKYDNDNRAENSLPGGYYVQAGAFSNYDTAGQLAARLADFGSPHIQKAKVNGRLFYRVRIGPYDYHAEAVVTQAKIRNFGIPAAHVVEN